MHRPMAKFCKSITSRGQEKELVRASLLLSAQNPTLFHMRITAVTLATAATSHAPRIVEGAIITSIGIAEVREKSEMPVGV